MTGRWAGVPVTASEGTPAPLAASVEAAAASARPAEGVVPPAPSAPDHDERAVRLALGWGGANLRLQRIRAVLDENCAPEETRRRILAEFGEKS